MPTGEPYFAWVDSTETTFGAEHLRWDEDVLEATVSHAEGEFAQLKVTIRNPRIGLLNVGAGRKIWAWFAIDCGSGNMFKIFARLIGIPSNIFHDTVDLDFVARPSDFEMQKAALADSLKTLPGYDPIFIDPQSETDPDTVLEAYGSRWYIGREDLNVDISDELEGEDGTLVFGPEEMLFDGLAMNISGSPVTTATVDVEFSWTQLASGGISLTQYITSNWPNEPGIAAPGTITSFTLRASNWPQAGANAGDGWVVSYASCQELYNITVRTENRAGKTIHNWANGSQTTLEASESIDGSAIAPGSVEFGEIVTQDETDVQYADSGVEPEVEGAVGSFTSVKEESSYRRDYSDTAGFVPLFHLLPQLFVSFDAKRPFVERVRFSLTSDVQPVLSEPEDGMIVRLPDMKSINLSEEIGETADAEIPIGDARRRSYLVTSRGQDSIRHVLSLLRATLRNRARVVEISFEPLLERMHEVTLRKSAIITDDRISGGFAEGKITAYSLSLNGDTGAVRCSVTIGSAVGRAGTVSAVPGGPEYVEEDYIPQEEDYQQYIGRVVLVDGDDLGFTLPLFNPNDDGVDFISGLTAADLIEDGLVVSFGPAQQRLHIEAHPWRPGVSIFVDNETLLEERREGIQNTLKAIETVASFRLRNMEGLFETPIEVEATGLKIPKMIDLETGSV